MTKKGFQKLGYQIGTLERRVRLDKMSYFDVHVVTVFIPRRLPLAALVHNNFEVERLKKGGCADRKLNGRVPKLGRPLTRDGSGDHRVPVTRKAAYFFWQPNQDLQ
jgi:hypothetical protein